MLPATIFIVGGALLGPYGDDGGLGRFYGDFFGDLAEPSVRAWAIALGPLTPYLAAAPGVRRGRPRAAGYRKLNRIGPPRPGARPKKSVASSRASAPSDLRSRTPWDHDRRVGNVTSLTVRSIGDFPARARV